MDLPTYYGVLEDGDNACQRTCKSGFGQVGSRPRRAATRSLEAGMRIQAIRAARCAATTGRPAHGRFNETDTEHR